MLYVNGKSLKKNDVTTNVYFGIHYGCLLDIDILMATVAWHGNNKWLSEFIC